MNVAWSNALITAKRDPSYAGSYIADNILWIRFTRDAQTKLAAMTGQPDIRAFTARHCAMVLDKAFQSTVALLDVARFGPTSAGIDFRQSAVTVGTAHSLQGGAGPTPACSALVTLPMTAPGTDVAIIDQRDCKK